MSGIQTNIFSPGASWAPKIKWLGTQPKTKGPRVRQKIELISTQFIYITYTLKICINYLESAEWRFVNLTASVRYDILTTIFQLFRGKLGP